MGDVKLVRAPSGEHIHSVEKYSGAAAGDLVKESGKVAAVGDAPIGFIVDDVPTDNPPLLLSVYGQGAIIDLNGVLTAGAVGTTIYSDGDGTISATQPAGAAGTIIWVVGKIVGDEDGSNSTLLQVNIYEYEKGA